MRFFDKASFNVQWVAGKTFEQFKAHEEHHGYTESELKEIHNLCILAAGKQREIAEKPNKGRKARGK